MELSEAGCRGTHLADAATPGGWTSPAATEEPGPGVAGMSPEAGPCREADFCIYLLLQPSVSSRL